MTHHPPTILPVDDATPTRALLAGKPSGARCDGPARQTARAHRPLLRPKSPRPAATHPRRPALRLLERRFRDLARIALGLPDGDGLALVERVRRADGVAPRVNPDVALVAVTARTAELDVLRGFERGVDDYLGKPFSYPELRAR